MTLLTVLVLCITAIIITNLILVRKYPTDSYELPLETLIKLTEGQDDDMVKFGEYVLSDERLKTIQKDHDPKQVYHADLENFWKQEEKECQIKK